MRNKVAAATALLLLVASTSPAISHADFSLVAATEHFSFFAKSPKLHVNAGKSEQVLKSVSLALGVSCEERIAYYRHQYPEEVAVYAGVYSDGVAVPSENEIHSVRDVHAHEIVHLVAAQLGDPGSALSEGLAVFLGDKGKIDGRDVDDLAKAALRQVSVDDLFERFPRLDSRVSYPLAGSFVKFLSRTYGMPAIGKLLRATRTQTVEEAFPVAFGTTLEGAAVLWARSLRVVPASATQSRWLDGAYSVVALSTR